MPEHYLGLTGARTINTAAFADTREAMATCAADRAVVAITGIAGCGKTFAVHSALEDLNAMEHLYLQFPPRTSLASVIYRLFAAVTGRRAYGDSKRLLPILADKLAERPRLLALDETQHFDKACFEVIRFLWDEPHTQFGVALIGGNGCWRILTRYPMLRSRIDEHVDVGPLNQTALLRVIRGYHTIYEQADTELIMDINEAGCDGVFREWAKVTRKAADLCAADDKPTITLDVARTIGAIR